MKNIYQRTRVWGINMNKSTKRGLISTWNFINIAVVFILTVWFIELMVI